MEEIYKYKRVSEAIDILLVQVKKENQRRICNMSFKSFKTEAANKS